MKTHTSDEFSHPFPHFASSAINPATEVTLLNRADRLSFLCGSPTPPHHPGDKLNPRLVSPDLRALHIASAPSPARLRKELRPIDWEAQGSQESNQQLPTATAFPPEWALSHPTHCSPNTKRTATSYYSPPGL